ncbi:MAG TPA: transcriptional regulator [Puia sp.]|nr:transcriptional regulator [Puia sp.]
MFNDLDPLLHSQLRLAIVSLLMNYEEANFIFIRERTKATDGNLSVQLSKLKTAGYIEVKRRIRDNYSETVCKITPAGIKAFEQYVKDIKLYLKVRK